MLEIKTLATGSKGNCYYINDGDTHLLIEAGIPFKDIQRGLHFQTSNIAGCLITHEHQDHCKGVKTVLDRGLNVYMSKGTKEALNIQHHRIKTVESKKQFQLGTWTILPFDVQHDVSEPYGYLLQSKHGYKVLFATDTYYIKYRFNGLTHILIECNWDEQTLNENIAKGYLEPFLKKRIMQSHMGLETLLDFFKANDLSKVQEIWLLHLSDGNANEERIRNEVAKVTGKMIYTP